MFLPAQFLEIGFGKGMLPGFKFAFRYFQRQAGKIIYNLLHVTARNIFLLIGYF